MNELELSSSEAARQQRRILLGFAVQPFVTALLGSALLPTLALTAPRLQPSSAPVIELAFVSGALVGVAGLLITVCLAAPLFYWPRAGGVVTWRHAAVSALLFANLPTTLLLGLSVVNGRDSRLLAVDSAMIAVRVVLLSSGIGVASAGIFWWIATGGRVGAAPTASNHVGSTHADDHG